MVGTAAIVAGRAVEGATALWRPLHVIWLFHFKESHAAVQVAEFEGCKLDIVNIVNRPTKVLYNNVIRPRRV